MKWLALAAGLLGLAVAIFAWRSDPAAFYPAWLAAMVTLAAWPLGSMALLLIHALTGGQWGIVLRPALRQGVFTLPLLFLAVLPLIGGISVLYPWARAGAAQHLHNGFYLNTAFLLVRVIVYCVAWSVLAVLSLRAAPSAALASAGLFILAVTTSFAAIDSTMSLEPRFVSSIYGMLTAAGMVLMALSIAVLLSAGALSADCRGDLGKLLLALTVLWIYLDFMQLLIIWQSDLAHDAVWYGPRARGAWGAVRGLIAVGHFVLPVALLLSPRLQRARGVLLGVAGLLIGMEVLRAWWVVLPAAGRFISVVDLACMIGVFGLALGAVTLPARVRHG